MPPKHPNPKTEEKKKRTRIAPLELSFRIMGSRFPCLISNSLPLCFCPASVLCPKHTIFSSIFAQCVKESGPAVGHRLLGSVLIDIHIKNCIFESLCSKAMQRELSSMFVRMAARVIQASEKILFNRELYSGL